MFTDMENVTDTVSSEIFYQNKTKLWDHAISPGYNIQGREKNNPHNAFLQHSDWIIPRGGKQQIELTREKEIPTTMKTPKSCG